MVKLSDVAARAGVSPAAVSRVLSGDATVRVSAETRERVLAAAHELEYVPNHAARALRTARTSTIALVVPDVTSAVFAELARGAEQEASDRGLAIVLGRAERLEEDSDWIRRLVGEGRIDGVILQLPDGAPPADLSALVAQGTPAVVINSVEEAAVSTLVLDDSAGVELAIDHLVGLGHRRVGLVGGLPGSSTGSRREAGFRRALEARGLPVDERAITRLGYTGADGRDAVAELAGRGPLPGALVVANLNAALGVLAEIHARGLRVPSDVSIVAIHDVWYADATWPPITTVRMPLRELGARAVALLDAPPGEVVHEVVATAPALVPRASTAPPLDPQLPQNGSARG